MLYNFLQILSFGFSDYTFHNFTWCYNYVLIRLHVQYDALHDLYDVQLIWLCTPFTFMCSFTISTISPYLHDALPYLILQIPSHVLKFLNFNFLLKCYSDHDTQIVYTTCSLFTLIFDVFEKLLNAIFSAVLMLWCNNDYLFIQSKFYAYAVQLNNRALQCSLTLHPYPNW